MWGHVSALDEFLECTTFSQEALLSLGDETWHHALFFHPHQMYSSVMLLELPYPLSLLQLQSGTYHLLSEIWQQSSHWSLCLNFTISSASYRNTNACQLCYFFRIFEGLLKPTPTPDVCHSSDFSLVFSTRCRCLLWLRMSFCRALSSDIFFSLSILKIPLFQKVIKLFHKCHIQLSHGNLSRITGVIYSQCDNST